MADLSPRVLSHHVDREVLAKLTVAQYSITDWRSVYKANSLVANMRRRDNCHDNTRTLFPASKAGTGPADCLHPTGDARSDAFDYMLYNAKRRYGFNNQLSPVAFKKRYAMNV